jgi:hypothetical protein
MDEEVPRHLLLFGSETVEGRDLIVVRLRIGAGLDQKNAETPDGEIRRQGSAAGSGADDDVVIRFGRGFDGVLLRMS